MIDIWAVSGYSADTSVPPWICQRDSSVHFNLRTTGLFLNELLLNFSWIVLGIHSCRHLSEAYLFFSPAYLDWLLDYKTMPITATECGLCLQCSFNHFVWFLDKSNQVFYQFQVAVLCSNREIATEGGENDCEKEILTLEPHLSHVAGVSLRDLK